MDAPSISRMMDNLAVQLDTLQMTAPASEPVARKEPAPVIPVPPPKVQMEEPLVLGGAEAPMIAGPVSPTMTVRVEAKQVVAPPKRFFGLFGRRRPESEQYLVEPRLEAPMPAPTAPRQPVATTTTRPAASAAAQPVSQPQAPAPSARAAAEPPRQQPTPSPDDLFAGVSEDDRFEIPAFLRRQANSGG